MLPNTGFYGMGAALACPGVSVRCRAPPVGLRVYQALEEAPRQRLRVDADGAVPARGLRDLVLDGPPQKLHHLQWQHGVRIGLGVRGMWQSVAAPAVRHRCSTICTQISNGSRRTGRLLG
jgi:hypothetical protein